MGQLFSSIYSALFPNKEYKLIMVGAQRLVRHSLTLTNAAVGHAGIHAHEITTQVVEDATQVVAVVAGTEPRLMSAWQPLRPHVGLHVRGCGLRIADQL